MSEMEEQTQGGASGAGGSREKELGSHVIGGNSGRAGEQGD